MRVLHLTRERALFGFAMGYYCLFNKTQEEVRAASESIGYPGILYDQEYGSIRIMNGGRVAIEIPDQEGSFMIAAYRESTPLMTQSVALPANTGDLYYTIRTLYNGNNRIALELVPQDG